MYNGDPKEVSKQLVAIESENPELFAPIRNIPIWVAIRYAVYFELLDAIGTVGRPVSNGHSRKKTIWRHLLAIGHDLVVRNPFLSGRRKYFFVGAGAARRRTNSAGKREDIWCDPIIRELGQNHCTLFEPNAGAISTSSKRETKNWVSSLAFEFRLRLSLKSPILTPAELEPFRDLSTRISEVFGVPDLRIDQIAQKNFTRLCVEVQLAKKILKRSKPRVLFVVCYYSGGKIPFILAAREGGVPVVEIQHGTIYKGHYGYTAPSGIPHEPFPDYFFLFGSFWKNRIQLPSRQENQICIGYPAFLQAPSKEIISHSSAEIVFISQRTIGRQLSQFANALARSLGSEWIIRYKLHPGEISDWKERYPGLVDSGIEVISSEVPCLNELFSKSAVQLGVYSTALYEGVAKGCVTLIVDLPGAGNVEDLIERGLATLVRSVPEAQEAIKNSRGKQCLSTHQQQAAIFGEHWEDALREALGPLLESTSLNADQI